MILEAQKLGSNRVAIQPASPQKFGDSLSASTTSSLHRPVAPPCRGALPVAAPPRSPPRCRDADPPRPATTESRIPSPRRYKSEPLALAAEEAMSKLQLPVDDSVHLVVTHSNLTTFSSDIRVSHQTTVDALKEKLWRKTGTAVAFMRLELRDEAGAKVADLDRDAAPLTSYSPFYDGYQLHVIDLDPSSLTSGGWLEDTSLIDKYTISDEAYDKLGTNFRKFKEKMVLKNPISDDKQQFDNQTEELCASIKVGDRCEVEPGAKRGTVKFVGKAEALGRGFWVGVQYDEPLGKHDGMVKSLRFFECPQGHGAIVRPEKVKVGDFPERDPFDEENEI